MIAKRISDGKVLGLIKMFLKAGCMEETQKKDNTKGTPQGGIISPLLANIYLDKLDKGWKIKFAPISKLIRYADDMVILTKRKANMLSVQLKGILESMKLTLNKTKTKVVNTEENSFDFLGFSYKLAYSPRLRKKSVIFWPSQQAEMSIKRKIKRITNFRRPVKVEQIVEELAPRLRGWVNYHRVSNAALKFLKIKEYTERRIRKFVRRRGKKNGYGYKDITKDYLYNQLGLFNDYHTRWM